MQAVIIYESLTGNTERAAYLMGDAFFRHRVGTRLMPTTGVDPEAVAGADLVVVGSWTDGFLVVGQRPGRAGRVRKSLPDLSGKRCVVYCTYAIDSGKTLQKLQRIVESHGGTVIGGMAIRRDELEDGADDFVERVLSVVAV
jgi:hypothetical protein